MRRWLAYALVSALGLAWITAPRAMEETGTVVRVLDGHRFVVKIGDKQQEIRLIGVEAPWESAFFTRHLLQGRDVRLRSEERGEDLGEDGLPLRYVYRDDGMFVNAEIIKHGYGRVYARHRSAHTQEFLALENEARRSKAGLWSWGDGLFSRGLTSEVEASHSRKPRGEEPSSSSEEKPLLAGTWGVSNPKVIYRVKPSYPEAARQANVQGRIVLRTIIRKDGTVGEIEVMRPATWTSGVESSGDVWGLERAAIAAVTLWRYEPAVKDGNPVDVYFRVVVEFLPQ